MFVKDVMVQNQVGLHARPATFFIQKANEFKSSIWVEKEERRVNAKSLLGVLSLGIVGGTTIRIIADGTDEADFRLAACMTTDSGIGVVRHAQAGYQIAKDVCNGKGKIAGGESIKIPLWWEPADKVTFGPEGEYVR